MFTFKLIHEDGTPADPPRFVASRPDWRKGDSLWIRPGYTLRVTSTRPPDREAEHGILVVRRG